MFVERHLAASNGNGKLAHGEIGEIGDHKDGELLLQL